MSSCFACGAENDADATVCGRCGKTLDKTREALPTSSGRSSGPRSTKPSNRIEVTRDTQGEVVVREVRPDGKFYRHDCPFCGRSVKVPDGADRCPFCGGQLDADAEVTVETEPAIANPQPRDPTSPLAVLYHILPSGDEEAIPLENRVSVIGRMMGIPKTLVFGRDPYLSPVHAEFRYYEEGVRVVDRDSLNGVFGQIRGPTPLEDGQMILMGEQIFKFEILRDNLQSSPSGADGTVPLGSGLDRPGAQVVKILADGGDGPSYSISGRSRVFGRRSGHYTFPEDALMSHQHAVIEDQAGRFILTDLTSTNGTMVRVTEAHVGPGAVVRMGSQRFRIEYRRR
jgi:pSer/pThr/pTyr-binding forkhead associated (FHA) protein